MTSQDEGNIEHRVLFSRPPRVTSHRPSTHTIIAHRGASAYAPESTRAAIQKAVALKADMIELDVQLTQDNRLVIFHDECLERTTTGQGRLSAWRYPDLARLDCGSWFAPQFAGARILLVSQALRCIPSRCHVNLELKRTSRAVTMIRQLVQCLRWTRTVRRVVISAFDPRLLASLKTRSPNVATALLCQRDPFRALRTAITLDCLALHPHKSLIHTSLVTQTHAAGLRLHVWTVDRVDEARRLLRMGVDGLITNAPDRFLRLRSTEVGG